MKRRNLAIDLGRQIGGVNRGRPGAVETFRELVQQWRGAIIGGANPISIEHEHCAACRRYWESTNRDSADCEGCPFAVAGGPCFCEDVAKRLVPYEVRVGWTHLIVFGVSASTLRSIKADIVAFLEAALSAASCAELTKGGEV